jgi:hypothetical protein
VDETARVAGVDINLVREGMYEVSNRVKLGHSEVEVLAMFLKGVKLVFEAERTQVDKLKEEARAAAP